MMTLQSSIAICAIDHYHSLPKHGKPRAGQEWTVYAALVVTSNLNKPRVVCSATGSKCTTTGPEGWCLRDLHAEVLVKRGFQRLLWKEIHSGKLELLLKLDSVDTSGEKYVLKRDLKLHLFISDSPCGDATIYRLKNKEMNFTGSKLIKDGELVCWNNVSVTREKDQQLGQLRTKSGRSNLDNVRRSTSLSCSDKILKWNLLGIQGSTLPVHPIRLDSLVVCKDAHAESLEAQQEALQRACVDRFNDVLKEARHSEDVDTLKNHEKYLTSLELRPLKVMVVDNNFDCSKSRMVIPFQDRNVKSELNENAKRPHPSNCTATSSKKVSPCGFCINWQYQDSSEVLVGTRGTKNGKKPATEADYARISSRLCRAAFYKSNLDYKTDTAKTYRQWKSENSINSERKDFFFKTKVMKGWIKSISDFAL
mmetsp:Transcript_3816/g.5563  ORF Transcript_3816/g.5563 Transcript_3816/m.5563 type:complete len:423 (+) Transcript_3816:107-1375(+)